MFYLQQFLAVSIVPVTGHHWQGVVEHEPIMNFNNQVGIG